MKPRFVNQPKEYDCGPIAILNALKWSGVPATLKSHYKKLFRACKTRGPRGPVYSGTRLSDFKKAIKKSGLRYSFSSRPTLAFVEKSLHSGRAILLRHDTPYGDGHFTLITKVYNDGEFFEVINVTRLHKVAVVRRETLRSWLHYKTGPDAWSIRNKETA